MRSEYQLLKQDLETIRRANVAEAAANERMASLIVTHLNPPLPEDKVVSFEARYGVELPEEYREFILTIANGGVGPGGGLEKLGQCYGMDWDDSPGLVGDLSVPFPYVDEWNAKPIDKSLPREELYRHQDWYWNSEHVHGAIPICHLGCNLRQLLIVTGPERNHIWFDDRADWQGLYPDSDHEGKRLSFFEWYRTWADEKLTTCNLP